MLAVSHRSSALPTLLHRGVMDESGTINPSALHASANTIAPNLLSQTQPSPRGIKRSRSPDGHTANDNDGADDAKTGSININKARKLKAGESPAPSQMTVAANMPPHAVQTPQQRTSSLPQQSPSQASPQRSTPGSATKPATIKALPTVRDHTTDQLGPEGDEYLPREIDDHGETKVSRDGYPLDGRKYKCRTFQVPNRGEKLFMLATECARVLGYRDSYLLFNKNRSLFKIIANQTEKDNLIHQEILPYSYRSRQIAIVTARSMFRQFGSRLIEGGRRVRDDYWEAKAIKQGFTEEDAAGEKRPGAAKQREQAAAEASQANVLTSLPQGEIIYSNSGPGFDSQPPGMGPASLAPLSMIHIPSEDLRLGGMGGNILRPRQEINAPAYIDRSQPSSANEILTQAGQAAEFNKQLSQTREHRAKYLDDYWRRPHEQPTTEAQPGQNDVNSIAPQNLQSPQAVAGMHQHRNQQEQMSHAASQMMSQNYSTYGGQQPSMTSPVQSMHRGLPPNQMQHGSPPMNMPGSAHRQTPSYGGYSQNQMWPPPQPQPSPLSQSHISAYNQQQQHHSPMPPPQMPQPGMGYPQMNQMSNPAYTGMARSMYQPNPNQFTMGPQSGAGQQPGMQGWTTPGSSNLPQNYGYQ
ncbi:nuclear localization protein [Zymoseptoria brevis]|uniref:Nuclear localization protein n=1 Tax=Zymoseptoria brevis TaxID=1047168 RepID=A0A0F4GV12_9PEZI|nr:nuclear localization protein [Zymoseptoria brevis]